LTISLIEVLLLVLGLSLASMAVLALASVLSESKLLGCVVLHRGMRLGSAEAIVGESLPGSVSEVIGERS